jgi:hypothetical protein
MCSRQIRTGAGVHSGAEFALSSPAADAPTFGRGCLPPPRLCVSNAAALFAPERSADLLMILSSTELPRMSHRSTKPSRLPRRRAWLRRWVSVIRANYRLNPSPRRHDPGRRRRSTERELLHPAPSRREGFLRLSASELGHLRSRGHAPPGGMSRSSQNRETHRRTKARIVSMSEVVVTVVSV